MSTVAAVLKLVFFAGVLLLLGSKIIRSVLAGKLEIGGDSGWFKIPRRTVYSNADPIKFWILMVLGTALALIITWEIGIWLRRLWLSLD